MNRPVTRRRMLRTLFCSSVAMRLNLGTAPGAEVTASPDSLDFLAIGDFGTGGEKQHAVARAMAAYAGALGKPADGLLLLGDNFYGPMKGGFDSPRWQKGFSAVYPGKVFPNPCWAVLGNHDYHDTPGNEKIQLGYAASLPRKTRWTMPGKYYRVDLPAVNPRVTFLMIDTNWKPINRRLHGDKQPCWISPEERDAQRVWLEAQLASKRAPFTVVIGHHPLYSEGSHGDTPELVEEIGPLLEKHGVHLYLGGHDHDLQHLELDKLRTSFVISGGGGAGLHKHGEVRKNSTVLDVHGFTHLSIRDKRLVTRHVDVTGKIRHTFSKGMNHDWRVEA